MLACFRQRKPKFDAYFSLFSFFAVFVQSGYLLGPTIFSFVTPGALSYCIAYCIFSVLYFQLQHAMFLPENLKDQAAEDAAEIVRKAAYVRIEAWTMALIPEQLREGVQLSVQEVQCGDPDCAPIDTAIAILFPA